MKKPLFDPSLNINEACLLSYLGHAVPSKTNGMHWENGHTPSNGATTPPTGVPIAHLTEHPQAPI